MNLIKPGKSRNWFVPFVKNIAWWAAPLAVLLTIWVPVILHYNIPTPVISDDVVAKGRQLPSDDVLDELKNFYYHKSFDLQHDSELLHAAEKLLEGQFEVAEFPPLTIHMPFDPEDLEKGPPEWQLEFAALVVPRILLLAYDRSHREEFLVAARDSILAWTFFERDSWLPKGHLWNDHAIAVRILVLTNFWRIYRHHELYQDEVAKTVFEFAARSAEFLASSKHFTFSTNHGVMQNLGLWHLALSFPTLPRSSEYAQLALVRFKEQMRYYLSDEGVILEHSAGYQEFGLNLLSSAFRYLALLDLSVESKWREKYESAKEYYALLRRPDGTLPVFGDTLEQASPRGPPVVDWDSMEKSSLSHYERSWTPGSANSLFPLSGYFIRWEGLEQWPRPNNLNQTVLTWSYFPGHGHKHADEMSMLLWANGQTWLTNHGYWAGAERWDGSNAPHLGAEKKKSGRRTQLKFCGWSNNLALVDLERRGPGEYTVRREVIRVKPHLWLVLDQSSGVETDVTTTSWMTPDEVSWKPLKTPTGFNLEGKDSLNTLTAFFLGSPGTTFRQVPAGYFSNTPGPAGHGRKVGMIVEQPANNSWALSVWVLNSPSHGGFNLVGSPSVSYLTGAENWAILLPVESGSVRISRNRTRLSVNGSGNPDESQSLTVHEPKDVGLQLSEIRTAFEQVREKYPRFRDFLAYRTKVTRMLLFIFLFQELAFMFIISAYRTISNRWYLRFRLLNLICWVGGGAWLHLAYFRS